MAAWDGELHCYELSLPDWRSPHWVESNAYPPDPEWWLAATQRAGLDLVGTAWALACCHVGRTLESYLVERRDRGFAIDDVDAHHAERILTEADTSGRARAYWGGIDLRYLSRGIGTALVQASVRWAHERGHIAVIALASPTDLFEFAKWSGHLPWTTYAKLGFNPVGDNFGIEAGHELPEWAEGNSPPAVMEQVRSALAAGRPKHEIRECLMALPLS